MADAKKCDRCGMYFEENKNLLSTDTDIIRTIVKVKTFNKRSTLDLNIDLCDECMTKLYRFLLDRDVDLFTPSSQGKESPTETSDDPFIDIVNRFSNLYCGKGFEIDFCRPFYKCEHEARQPVLDLYFVNGDRIIADLTGKWRIQYEYYEGMENEMLEELAVSLKTTARALKENMNYYPVACTFANGIITTDNSSAIRILTMDNNFIIYIPNTIKEEN